MAVDGAGQEQTERDARTRALDPTGEWHGFGTLLGDAAHVATIVQDRLALLGAQLGEMVGRLEQLSDVENEALRAEVKQLRYERQLLGRARRVLDLRAEGYRETAAAAALSQAIVDEIGHPATDEPAMGPTLRQALHDIHEIVRIAGVYKDVNPIRNILHELRKAGVEL